MKALILGANGQVGRMLVRSAPLGSEVAALGRAECDISNEQAVAAAIASARPDVVINAAAYTAVDRAEAEPTLARLINAVAPGWIATAAKSVGARTVHVSSDFVFDGLAHRPYAPSDPPAPLGVYGQTKLEGERAVVAADPDALIVRTAWVYAATGANFVNTMLRLMRERPEVRVVADQIGTPTFAGSLAQALWTLVGLDAAGTFHFTDSGVASWYDFAVAILEEAQQASLLGATACVRPITTAEYPTPARRPAFSVLDKSLTWDLLGEAAPHWRVTLRVALNELGKNG